MRTKVVVLGLWVSVGAKAQLLNVKSEFAKANNSAAWKLTFHDEGTTNWQNAWFVDGYRATVTNTKDGMLFSAGPVDGDDACHAVLWTKQSFAGDIKITYDYTRTDAYNKWVNILYIQATGIGSEPYVKDIAKWQGLRNIPYMRLYFDYMKALHISYAAYGDTLNKGPDYIRVRTYPRKPGAAFGASTEVAPAFFDTGLFEPGKMYQITVIKKGGQLFMNVKGEGQEKLFRWNIANAKDINEGRIGLRHMFTRSALYKNFRVYSAP